MKTSSLFLISIALAGTMWAQAEPQKQSPAELPDAPSVKVQPKPAPAPPQQPKAAPAAPAAKPAAAAAAGPDKPAQAPQPAAQKPGEPSQGVETLRLQVNEVNVIFTATDKHGRFVKDLKAGDIQVLDDKKPPHSIVNFRSETDLPLRVGLLVDVSSSIRDRFKFEQEAAIEFLSQMVRIKSDKAFVIGFDATPEVTTDFTDSTEQLTKGVRMLRPGGGTAMYDALYYACRDKLLKVNAESAVRRAVILITDGDDNQSHVTRSEAIEMAQRAEVIVYAISTNISGVKQRGDRVLEMIADETGGRAFFPFHDQDMPSYFLAIQDELRSQYAVAYRPADFQMDGRYRSIDITTRKKDLHIRARKGYYAPTK